MVDDVKEPAELAQGEMALDTYRRQERFASVMLPHLDAAHNLARWLMRDADAAEDVLQDAMVRALTYFPSFKGINPRGWLLQIVRNTAYGSINLNRGIQLVPIATSEEDGVGTITDLPSADDDPETNELDQIPRSSSCPTINRRIASRIARDVGVARARGAFL
jgi:DNA-directed RNA polymerase specialized sigma24 family protein